MQVSPLLRLAKTLTLNLWNPENMRRHYKAIESTNEAVLGSAGLSVFAERLHQAKTFLLTCGIRLSTWLHAQRCKLGRGSGTSITTVRIVRW
jgi:hypothetical protein